MCKIKTEQVKSYCFLYYPYIEDYTVNETPEPIKVVKVKPQQDPEFFKGKNFDAWA